MEAFLVSPAIAWIPHIILSLVLLLAAWRHFMGRRSLKYKTLAHAALWFRFGWAAFLTAGQYYLWSKGGLSQLLLTMPLNESLPIPLVKYAPGIFGSRIGYFLFYSWGHFWLNAVLAVGIAWLFYRFLLVLERYNDRFFEEGDARLGFVCALAAGWPGILVFIGLSLALVVLASLFRMLFLREQYTPLGGPFLFAAAAALWLAPQALSYFGLGLHV